MENRVEKHNIKRSSEFYEIIDDLCFKSKNIYNYANYIVRQEFIKTSREKEAGLKDNAIWIQYNDLYKTVKESDAYKQINSKSGQATLRILNANWKGFFKSIKDYKKHPEKYKGRPRLPNYLDKENGRFEFCLNNQQFKIKNGFIFFGYTPLKIMNDIFKTKIPEEAKLIQIRFVPKLDEYIMEVVYQINVPELKESNERIASIDLGVNNLMTVTTNFGYKPFVINGRPLKSINQYYNKELADMKSKLKIRNNKESSKEIRRFTTKRNNKIDDYIHKATRIVVDFCKENEVDTLVCGYNENWKQEVNIGSQNNQNFVGIPHSKIVWQLMYKCQNEGISFIKVEESYTSKTSFLDNEEPIKENADGSRRKHRGLFVTKKGEQINADVNGSYQIMKKAFPNAFANGIVGADSHPIIVNIPL